MHQSQGLVTVFILLVLCCVNATDEHHKRAPSGFLGVRGKKSIAMAEHEQQQDNSIIKEADPPGEISRVPPSGHLVVDKRSPYSSSFVGMRGKKPWDYSDALYKRAPQGFFGMRGKKNEDDEDYFDNIYPKRAPMGFFGVRGKKYVLQPYLQDQKRAPNGFFGMRGKKDFEDFLYEEEKRAPQSAFFGVRGKRMGFFGMRGKKIPYEFRGKFVGVRGKKSPQNNVISAESNQNNPNYLTETSMSSSNPQNDLEWNQLMLLLTEQNDNEDINVPTDTKNP